MNVDITIPTILAIDPDPVSLAAISTALDCQGHQVHGAPSSAIALDLASKLPLDLIITELNVDELGGIELLMQIRSNPRSADVPVMFVSPNQAPNVIRRIHEFGAAYHLKKPFDGQVLQELTQRALWMPHLVHSHLKQVKRPHMPILPVTSANPSTTLPTAL